LAKKKQDKRRTSNNNSVQFPKSKISPEKFTPKNFPPREKFSRGKSLPLFFIEMLVANQAASLKKFTAVELNKLSFLLP